MDTPLRLPTLIPEAYIVPVTSGDWFLHTSPELCMKRLLAHGAEKLFQLCHCFRGEESGRLHQPEFTMLEWYRVGWNYHDLMQECEELFGWLATRQRGWAAVHQGCLRRDGKEVELAVPWQRLSVEEAFERYSSMELRTALSLGCFDEVLVEEVEPHLGRERPVFLVDYPVELGALARRKPGDSRFVERFELYCCGIELANGFSELIDPAEQRDRFLREMSIQSKEYALPEKFLDDLHLLEECAGIAVGADRLLMLLQGARHLDDVIPFTQTDL